MADDIRDWLAKEEADAEQWGGLGGAQFYREQFAAARAEIERLRAERDDLQVLLKGRTAEFQAEIERLRAERDAERALADQLAKALDRHGSHSLCTMLCSVCVTLAAQQEARRG